MFLVVNRTKDYNGSRVYAGTQIETYPTEDAAFDVAQRLAKANPSLTYFVMRGVAEVQVKTPVYVRILNYVRG